MGNLRHFLSRLKAPLEWTLGLLEPWTCLICGSPSDDLLCEGCRGDIYPIRPPLCPLCGLPYPPGTPEHPCGPCKKGTYPFLHRSYGLHEGSLREAIHLFKYRGLKALVEPLGTMLLEAYGALGASPDLLVPIPLTPQRARERGFNQSLLLCRWLSKRVGVPVRDVLLKLKDTPPQASLSGQERRRNLKGAFAVGDPRAVVGRRVLLVDDVFTTGTTLSEAARALLKAGAAEVYALTLARSL